MRVKIFLFALIAVTFISCASHQPELAVNSEAYTWLSIARREVNDGDVSIFIGFMREHLQKESLSFQEIGTCEQEIFALIRKGHIVSAQCWFEAARRLASQENVVIQISMMEKHCVDGRFSYVDIGTTAPEVENLLRKGYASEARKILEKIRVTGPDQIDTCEIVDMIGYIHKSRATLAEIGTNDAEMSGYKSVVLERGCHTNR